MIAFLSGVVAARGPGWVDLDVGGIGFHLLVSAQAAAALPGPGLAAKLPTALVIREDGVTLFGFQDEAEREAFGLLTTVSGIGGRLALATLSLFAPRALAQAVEGDDTAALCRVPGIGKRTAARLVLELKGRLGVPGGALPAAAPGAKGPAPAAEAAAALVALGYGAAEAAAAVAAVDEAATEPAALVRAALRGLARQ